MSRKHTLLCMFALSLAACGGGTNTNTDSGRDGTSADGTGTDVTSTDSTTGNDVTASDTAADDVTSGNDGSTTTDVVATDSTTSSDTGSGTDGSAACTAGVECSNYAAVLATQPRGATSLANCVVQLHQSDCCGATRAYGINHGARTELCPAETACVASYPSPASCTDNTITTDTGETTTMMSNVKIRIVNPAPCGFDPSMTCYTCETFVCTNNSCRSAPGIAGGCG